MRPRPGSLLLLATLAGCGRPGERLTTLEGATMGTTYSVQVVDLPATLASAELHSRVDETLRAIEERMSTYDPDSELSRFNASDSTDWFPVSGETLAVIEEALRVSHLSAGAFDVTVGPLVELWGFGPGGERARPAPAAIEATLASVGFRRLETRPSPPSIRKRVPGLRVDLSAIAKGFAVDEIARLLLAAGVRAFLIEVGGELRAGGHGPSGAPWRIAVERPQPAARAPACVLQLEDGAVASSGDYRKAFEQDGVRYAHVLDPRSGRPVSTGVALATVLSASAAEADAFATALMVLPPDEGLRLAERQGLAARLLVRDDGGFSERHTPRFPATAAREGPHDDVPR